MEINKYYSKYNGRPLLRVIFVVPLLFDQLLQQIILVLDHFVLLFESQFLQCPPLFLPDPLFLLHSPLSLPQFLLFPLQ